MINGRTKVCGLIGNPVEHTLSPVIHNQLADMLGENLVYVPFLVKNNLELAVKGAYELNVQGMNVTVPYKSQVIPYLSEIDELAAGIGAVNTLVRTEHGFKGYNTDMEGLYRALSCEKLAIENRRIIVLGAGGAARAVTYLCGIRGAEKVYLLNRSRDKADLVAKEVNESVRRDVVEPMLLTEYSKIPKDNYLIIQGTSVGLYPDTDSVVIDDPEFYKLAEAGYDLIYRPEKTRFMKMVEEAGAKAYNGLTMLLYQGIIAFELFTNTTVTQSQAQKILLLMKKEMMGNNQSDEEK